MGDGREQLRIWEDAAGSFQAHFQRCMDEESEKARRMRQAGAKYLAGIHEGRADAYRDCIRFVSGHVRFMEERYAKGERP